MIAGLVIGKHTSLGCPGKNIRPVLGRPMVEYAFMAARFCSKIEAIFVSTDSPDIAEIGYRYEAQHIERPSELATPDALTEDTLMHAFNEMQERTKNSIEIVVLLCANSPTIAPGTLHQAITILEQDVKLDSVFGVCKYNMWSPLRARRIDERGLIQPYVPLETFCDPSQVSSIRGAGGDAYFCDLAVQVMRSRCLIDMENGQLPFKWMGRFSYALETSYGFDIDYEWQIPVIEYWLRQHGFSESATPYMEAQPHALPVQ